MATRDYTLTWGTTDTTGYSGTTNNYIAIDNAPNYSFNIPAYNFGWSTYQEFVTDEMRQVAAGWDKDSND